MNQYQIEAEIYKILSQYDLPFIMQHYKTYICDNFTKITKQHTSPLISQINERGRILFQHQQANYNFHRAQILVIERGGAGSSLEAAIRAIQSNRLANLSDEDWCSIFIQTVFCLCFLEDIGIMHHDLHLGNIWLDQTDKKVKYTLKIRKDAPPIVFITNYLVKIYDFDHATITATKYRPGSMENNHLTGMCALVGECNQMKNGRDYYQFCWWLHKTAGALLPKLVGQFIEQSVNTHFLNNNAGNQPGSLSWSGHPCIIQSQGKACEPYETPSVIDLLERFSKTVVTKEKLNAAEKRTDFDIETVLYLPSYAD